MERLKSLDAAFIDAEDQDQNTSFAIASIAVFEGPAPSYEEFVAAIARRLPLVPLYRRKLRKVPFGLGPPVWVDDPNFDVQVPRQADGVAGPRRGPGASAAHGARDDAAAGPRLSVVGVLAGRGARARPLGADLQGAPCRGRRGVGHRPLPGDLRCRTGSAVVACRAGQARAAGAVRAQAGRERRPERGVASPARERRHPAGACEP